MHFPKYSHPREHRAWSWPQFCSSSSSLSMGEASLLLQSLHGLPKPHSAWPSLSLLGSLVAAPCDPVRSQKAAFSIHAAPLSTQRPSGGNPVSRHQAPVCAWCLPPRLQGPWSFRQCLMLGPYTVAWTSWSGEAQHDVRCCVPQPYALAQSCLPHQCPAVSQACVAELYIVSC